MTVVTRLLLHVRANYIHGTYNHIHTDGARTKARLVLRLGDIRESGETGDSGEEEDTQWGQVITLYTRVLRKCADSAHFWRVLHEVATCQSHVVHTTTL